MAIMSNKNSNGELKMSNEITESQFKTPGQLQVANAEKVFGFIQQDFGISTLPSSVKDDKKKLVEIYKKLIDNGGDDSFIYDIDDEDLKSAPINLGKKETIGQKRRRLKKELMVLWSVTIHDKNPTETIDSDDHTRVRFVSWGNDIVGHFTTRVVFDKDIFVHEGCLRNLRQLKFRRTSTKRGSNKLIYGPQEDRFQISYNDNVTQETIDEIAKKQALVESAGL